MPHTIDQLNQASTGAAADMLDGLYEHSPWVAAAALAARPFPSVQALADALAQALAQGSAAQQLALIRAHPELAGKAAQAGTLTAESTSEQKLAGLNACTPEELTRIQALNRQYGDKFGFPFIICVRGPTGRGLSKQEILSAFTERVTHDAATERAEALRQINRIASLRLQDKFAA